VLIIFSKAQQMLVHQKESYDVQCSQGVNMPNHNRFGIERNRKQNHEDKHGETHNERVEWVIMISLSRRVGRPQWDDWGERGRDFRQKLEPLKNLCHTATTIAT
jgi:hypothetical protein